MFFLLVISIHTCEMSIHLFKTSALLEFVTNKTVLITLSETALNCSIVLITVGAEKILLFFDQTAPRH